MEKEQALVHFSGGLDSLLSTCMTIEDGYKALLVHYNNGSTFGVKNVFDGYKRLLERYGEDVSMWGVGMTVGFLKVLRDDAFKTELYTLAKIMPELSMGQVNCLTCRSAMYVFSVILCLQKNIRVVVDGARKTQGFCLERDGMISRYREFFNSYGISFLTPVLDLKTDYEREISLYVRSINPTPNESKCFLGVPITFGSESEMLERDKEAVSFWDNELEPKCHKLIRTYKNVKLDNRGKLF